MLQCSSDSDACRAAILAICKANLRKVSKVLKTNEIAEIAEICTILNIVGADRMWRYGG
jgi:hypothetical protein